MSNKKRHSPSLMVGTAITVAVFVVTCVIGMTVLFVRRDIVPTYSATQPPPELASPAITHCIKNHQGTVVTKQDAAKNVWSYCALPENKLCEVWELYRTQTCIGATE